MSHPLCDPGPPGPAATNEHKHPGKKGSNAGNSSGRIQCREMINQYTTTMNQPPQQQLNDVLQDPDASWAQIREHLKSSRGVTNVAIMGAIASGRGVSVVPVPEVDSSTAADIDEREKSGGDARVVEASMRSEQELDENSTDNDVKNNEAASTKVDSEEGSTIKVETIPTPSLTATHEHTEIPLKDAATSSSDLHDVTNSCNRRPSRRARRSSRGSITGSRSSLRWSQQRMRAHHLQQQHQSSMKSEASGASDCSMNASINIMDFGVDYNRLMGTLKESQSMDDSALFSRRSSVGSDNSESIFSGSGFLGWNHDDESVGVQSNYSDLVDSSGFLDWDRKVTASITGGPPGSPTDGVRCIITEGIEGLTPDTSQQKRKQLQQQQQQKQQRVPGRRSSMPNKSFTGSFVANSLLVSFIQKDKVEQWNIEDYEKPTKDNEVHTQHNSNNNLRGRLQRGESAFGFFGDHLKRLSIDQAAPPSVKELKREEVHLDDIKEALIKVSAGIKPDGGANQKSRRGLIDDNGDASHTTASATNNMHGSSNKPSQPPPRRRRQTVNGMPMAMPTFLPAVSEPPEPNDSSDSLASASNASENIWGDGLKSNSKDDLREAIWINRKDGDVDIDKECRRLYGDKKNESNQNKNGRRRRVTLMGGERPNLLGLERMRSVRGDQNAEWDL